MVRKPRYLTKLRIDEISSVDRGAGEGTRIVLMKRHDRMSDNARRYAEVFKGIDWSKAMTSKPQADDTIDDGTDQDDLDTDTKLSPALEQHINALILAVPSVTPSMAAHFLLHTSHGRELLRTLTAVKSTTKGDTTTMDFMTGMTEIAKADGGMVAIAKNIIDKGETKLTEAQFTQLLTEHARLHKIAGESDGTAFSRIFSAQTPESLEIRKAHAITKNTLAPMMSVEPVVVGGDDFDVNDAAKAYQALTDLANEQRRRSPELSVAQAFSREFERPENRELAARAHRRPNASDAGAHPFPT